MMADIADSNLSDEEIDALMESLSLDLMALFGIMEDDVMAVFDKGINEGWQPERIIVEIDKLFGERNENKT